MGDGRSVGQPAGDPASHATPAADGDHSYVLSDAPPAITEFSNAAG